MNFKMNQIASAESLALNTTILQDKLTETQSIIVFENNAPQFVILSIEEYERMQHSHPVHQSSAPIPHIPTLVPTQNATQDTGDLKIGKFVKDTMRSLFACQSLPIEEINNLLSPDYSNQVFNLNFPVLKLYDPNIPFDKQKRDGNGYNRFYAFTLIHESSQYLLCSQWVEHLHRSYFEHWLEKWTVE